MDNNLLTGKLHRLLLNRLLRLGKAASISIFFVAVGLAPAEPPIAVHVHNFGKVDRTFYRGAQPSSVALQELRAQGIKVIIDLRESGQSTIRERQQAEQLGMQYVNVPLPALAAPGPDQVRTVLWLLTNHGNTPIFLHCRRGKDRTGTMVACYRVQHDGWDNAKALEEASEYGMSRAERGMRSFVLHFSALSPSALLPVTSIRLPAQP